MAKWSDGTKFTAADVADIVTATSSFMGIGATATDNFKMTAGKVAQWLRTVGFAAAIAAAVSPAAINWVFQNGSGADNAAGNFTLTAPLSTGNATPASVIIQVGAQVAGSSSTLQTAGNAVVFSHTTAGLHLATFGGRLASVTAITTPSAFVATTLSAFPSTVSGAAIMGFGTTNDVALMNRAGTVCLGVGPNTTAINIPGTLQVANIGINTAPTGNKLVAISSVATYVMSLTNIATAGSSYGLLVDAGGNTSDNSVLVRDRAGSVTYFRVRGDGAATFSSTLDVTGAVNGGPALFAGTSDATFQSASDANSPMRLSAQGYIANHIIKLDFKTADRNIIARIGAKMDGNGGALLFGTSNTLTGITNTALTIDYQGAASFSSTLAVTGRSAVGAVALNTAVMLNVVSNGTETSGTTQYGLNVNHTGSAAATTSIVGTRSLINTLAAAFTCASGIGHQIDSPTIGAGSAITTVYGLKVEDQTGGGTNYAIYTGAGLVRLGDAVSFTGGTFTTSLISTTALATPSALVATQFTAFASTVSGAAIMGFGTTHDVALMNRAGTTALGVIANTTGVAAIGAFTVGNLLTVTAGGATITAGNLGIGVVPQTDNALAISGTPMSGTTQKFINVTSSAQFSSAATTAGYGIHIQATTTAAAYTMTDLYGIFIAATAKGAGSTITNRYGLFITGPTDGATINTAIQANGGVGTVIFASTGQSLTGSLATTMISLAGTWNTSGTPTAFSLAITNTASNAASLLMDLLAGAGGATSMFSVSVSGQVVTAGAILAGTDLRVAAASAMYWSARGVMRSPATGQFNLLTFAETAGVGFDVATNNILKLRVTAQNAYATFDALAYQASGTKVVGAQGAAVADASGGAVIDAEARTALNALLGRVRTHGLIAT